MNWIDRIAHVGTKTTLVAGAYTKALNVTMTVGPFPLIITEVALQVRANDVTTSKSILCQLLLDFDVPPERDQPGLHTVNPLISLIASTHSISKWEFYTTMSPQESFGVRADFYLESVTANSITAYYQMTIKYRCPKDFLSVEPFII